MRQDGIDQEFCHAIENDLPSALRLLGTARVRPPDAMVISLAVKLESDPLLPEASMRFALEKLTWPKLGKGTSLQNNRLQDDGASATTSADERAKPFEAVCVVENDQPAVVSFSAR